MFGAPLTPIPPPPAPRLQERRHFRARPLAACKARPSVRLLKEITQCAIIKPHCSRIRRLENDGFRTVRGFGVWRMMVSKNGPDLSRPGV